MNANAINAVRGVNSAIALASSMNDPSVALIALINNGGLGKLP